MIQIKKNLYIFMGKFTQKKKLKVSLYYYDQICIYLFNDWLGK